MGSTILGEATESLPFFDPVSDKTDNPSVNPMFKAPKPDSDGTLRADTPHPPCRLHGRYSGCKCFERRFGASV